LACRQKLAFYFFFMMLFYLFDNCGFDKGIQGTIVRIEQNFFASSSIASSKAKVAFFLRDGEVR
jgi:hypothetical protein